MTKSDLANAIARRHGINRNEATGVVETVMDEITNSLVRNEPVFLRGFGTFKLAKRREKKARDINRDKTVVIPPHKVPVWKPSKLITSYFKPEVIR